MNTQEILIDGMSCNHCVMAVKKALTQIAGLSVQSVEVGKATVMVDETPNLEHAIKQAIEDAGFSVRI